MWKWLCLSAVTLGTVCAAGRADLSGVWELDRTHSGDKVKSETLQITQSEGAIQIADTMVDADGKEQKSDIQCNTLGKECKLKGEQVSLWYNGPMLVVMEMRRANEVVKKQLKTSDDGQTLKLDVIHIAPAGEKDETLTFTKQPSAARAAQ
jgi:hypothetical protein